MEVSDPPQPGAAGRAAPDGEAVTRRPTVLSLAPDRVPVALPRAWYEAPPEPTGSPAPFPALARPPAFQWPLHRVVVNSSFGWRRHPMRRYRFTFHRGLDLDGERGDPVMAVAEGVVTFAGFDGPSGFKVTVEHPGGYRSTYLHLSELLVDPGMHVARGAPVGLVGSTGRSTGNHLHLEISRDGIPLDPIPVLVGPTALPGGEGPVASSPSPSPPP